MGRLAQLSWWQVRDILLFLGGFGGVAHETFFATAERPDLLVLFAGMMGLPAFLQADTRRERRRQPEAGNEP